MDQVRQFLDFVRRSPTAFHATAAVAAEFLKAGFQQLNEFEPWSLKKGGRYFVTRNMSSIIAFMIPECGLSHFQIIASHGDSPTFKLKPFTEDLSCHHYLRLNTEPYGSVLFSSWMDRPLSIAGRLIIKEGDHLVSRLAELNRDAVLIPNLPIHLNRTVNESGGYNAQIDLLPLYATSDDVGTLKKEFAGICDVDPDSIIASDLFLYNRTPGTLWGVDNCFYSSPRIDDLGCAFSSMQAFLSVRASRHMNVYVMFDHEEVGNGGRQGANSTFLADVLARVASVLGASDSEYRRLAIASFMTSSDNVHAVHPNHPEKFDATNRVYMNEGIVFKHCAAQKYTTDAVSNAIFAEICVSADVPTQHFANRSDMPGGATLGRISNTHVSVPTVDIGLPQLSMHSSYETAGSKDMVYMIRAMTAFYETDIQMCQDNRYRLRR
ncbi:MAG: M18 family aminopeptidase [Christensenellales bacterium]|nr:M18 family aminopeptidase [Christensenellales bacterium]